MACWQPKLQRTLFSCTRGASALSYLLVAWIVVSTPLMNAAETKDSGSSTRTEEDTHSAASPHLPSAPVMATGSHAKDIASRLAKLDPELDEWDTEVVQNQIGNQLRTFGLLLLKPKGPSVVELTRLAAPDVEVGKLRPQHLTPVFKGEAGTVFRATKGSSISDTRRGIEELQKELQELVLGFRKTPLSRTKFKIFRIEVAEDRIQVSAYYLGYALGEPSIQQNSVWHTEWTKQDDQTAPRLLKIEVADFEEIVGPAIASTMFSDDTTTVLGKEPGYLKQLTHGVHHWQTRMQSTVGTDVYGHQGLALGDVNGDGLDDLFVCQAGGLPNRLFIHNPDGTATDQSRAYGVDMLDKTSSALFVDFDNDGDQDLVLLTSKELLLFANEQHKRFSRPVAVTKDTGHAFSLSAADYDLDGKVDLYLCGYSYPNGDTHVPTPYHDANNGFRNRLLRNKGKLKFVKVTSQVGLEKNNHRYSFSSSWEDFDNDGDLDLYVANDYGRNNLFRNDVPEGGGFVDIAANAGVEDISAGMSVSWGDYNNDGLMDIYISNMFSSAGNRVTYQRRFRYSEDSELAALYQRHARGNSLFENAGDGTFRDVSHEKRVTMGRWAWGSKFIDLNNDGREDILVANGNITGIEKDDL